MTLYDILKLCSSKSGLQTSNTGILWELNRNAESQSSPQMYFIRICTRTRSLANLMCVGVQDTLLHTWTSGPKTCCVLC